MRSTVSRPIDKSEVIGADVTQEEKLIDAAAPLQVGDRGLKADAIAFHHHLVPLIRLAQIRSKLGKVGRYEQA